MQRKILVIVMAVIFLALAPSAYLVWLGTGHRLEPLAMPIPLKPGVYTSPFFTTELDDNYQIDLYFLPTNRGPLEVDWKIVDAHGTKTLQNTYKEEIGGSNNVVLERQYRPKRWLRQQIIVTIRRGDDTPGATTTLHIGLPEQQLGIGYAFIPATLWAVGVIGLGAIVWLVQLLLKRRTRESL